MKKICVIGAGCSGLPAIKSCREENLEVDCFEATDNFGGLWRYHDDTVEGKASVMKTTVINTSKEMTAYSDFPPPKEFPNFMSHTYIVEYFRLYAEHFDLFKHIRYNCKVMKVEMADDYKETGRWLVTVQDLKKGETFTDIYDGVMVCSGHHTHPYLPNFEGIDDFQGTIRHTHSLKNENGFEDKNVLVIGIGNSGVDAAVELSRVTKKLYLSTRRGSWIFTRLLYGGMPYDSFLTTRLFNLAPLNIANLLLEFTLNLKIDHKKYGLKPAHKVLSAHGTINDTLPHSILSGKTVIKQDIERFTKNGVIFKRENETTLIEEVILATGYEIKHEFIAQEISKVKRNSLDLYKLVFPPHLQHPSLAFVGLIQPGGSIFPISEAQSRWYAQLMIGKCKLPTCDDMKREVKDRHQRLSQRFVNSPRHTIQVDILPYMDELCSEFQAKPNLWKMAVTDPVLYWACLTGPGVSYQYRLQGPHTWEGARDALLTLTERIEAPLQTRRL